MENKLIAYFSINLTKGYPVVINTPYTDNFNEELDSMSIVIDGITEDDKLNFNEPYVFVKIINKSINSIYINKFLWDNNEYLFMLLDSWVETNQNGFYKYEINLMSFTKILEKIQCPSRMITHSLVSGQKTIYDYINEYMTLYCPKIKVTEDGSTWDYEYLFNWTHLSNYAPFQQKCADLQFNEPTLRELLTTLMLQVDHIPMMKYRDLYYIDFKAQNTTFSEATNLGITFPVESGASDSFSTSLTISPTQVLDTDNEVISEKVGFRDRNNALISQIQNLQLETRFPIYNIKKVYLNSNNRTSFFAIPQNQNYEQAPTGKYPYPVLYSPNSISDPLEDSLGVIITHSDFKIHISFCFLGSLANPYIGDTGVLKNIKVHYCHWISNDYYQEVASTTVSQSWNLNLNNDTGSSLLSARRTGNPYRQILNSDGSIQTGSNPGNGIYSYRLDLDIPVAAQPMILDPTNYYIWFEYDYEDSYNNTNYHMFVPIRRFIKDANNSNLFGDITPLNDGVMPAVNQYYNGINGTYAFVIDGAGYRVDITPLVVEQKKRSLLNTDYSTMPTTGTLEDLAEYIYATMGYSIGDNKITGFSETYSRAQMWWSLTTSYLDTILDFIINNDLDSMYIDYNNVYVVAELNEKSLLLGNMPLEEGTIGCQGGEITKETTNKGKYIFDITYQPLNNFKLKIPKENKNIPLDLTVLNNTESGLEDFNRLVRNTQSMVNRIGNKIIQIPQTTDDFSKIQPLNSIYKNKYIVFKRSISINGNFITCLYTLAEKYVMQNYFTSIITKYRAYEYVDYNQSTIRKENLCIYCLLSDTHYLNGDDYIKWLGSNKNLLLSALNYDIKTKMPAKYIVRVADGLDKNNDVIQDQATKEEISTITYDSGFAICFQEFDNVSAGLYLRSADLDSGSLGGAEQEWQKWDTSYYEKHYVCVVNRIKFIGLQADEIDSYIKLPVLDQNMSYSPYQIFYITNNDSNTWTYYKDNAEIINQTIQFHYYTDKENDILFSENLFKFNSLIDRKEIITKLSYNNIFIELSDEFKLNTNTHSMDSANIKKESEIVSYYSIYNNQITIYWDEFDEEVIKIGLIISKPQYFNFYNCKDIIAFKRNGRTTATTYYLSLNDNQSTDIWKFINNSGYDYDGLFETYDCSNNESSRLVGNLKN